jgi:uncharacterized OB-fold protein
MPEYRGLNLMLLPQDIEYQGHIEAAQRHELAVQKCGECGLLRYPPGCACPWCTSMEYTWQVVSGKGTIYSYEIVMQAILPGFVDWTPYPVVLVELDEQRGMPTEDEGLRVLTNLLKPDGSPEDEANVAIGKRVEVTFTDVDEQFSLPQFKLSSEPPQGAVWQFPH